MALEKIREQEEQLKQIMIYAGRPGLWGDWQSFKQKRELHVEKRKRPQPVRRKIIFEITITLFFVLGQHFYHSAFIALLMHHKANYNSLAKIRVL